MICKLLPKHQNSALEEHVPRVEKQSFIYFAFDYSPKTQSLPRFEHKTLVESDVTKFILSHECITTIVSTNVTIIILSVFSETLAAKVTKKFSFIIFCQTEL